MFNVKQITLCAAAFAFIFTGCSASAGNNDSWLQEEALAEEKLHQPPTKPVIERVGNEVHIEMTAQVTNIEISEDVIYNAWTFNGTVPGPVIRVKQGDVLHFTLKNIDPKMPHSMDFHAVDAAPNKQFIDVMPNEQGTFTYAANSPGVFMYHCGTQPVLAHIASGMYGTIIVEPNEGYPSDEEVDREYTIVQSEWYTEGDFDAFMNEEPEYVVFNGDDFTLKEKPFLAKLGETVRFYVTNAGPNEVSSLHIVGTILDRVYLDGHPSNVQYGMQTVLLPAGGGAIIAKPPSKKLAIIRSSPINSTMRPKGPPLSFVLQRMDRIMVSL